MIGWLPAREKPTSRLQAENAFLEWLGPPKDRTEELAGDWKAHCRAEEIYRYDHPFGSSVLPPSFMRMLHRFTNLLD